MKRNTEVQSKPKIACVSFMPKRFLNVEYNRTGTKIDVTTSERLGEVQVAVKEAFSIDVGLGLIQLYDKQGQHITDLGDISEEYYMKSKNGGLFLVLTFHPRLYFVVPPDRFDSFRYQSYHGTDGKPLSEEGIVLNVKKLSQ
ncbi:hypothetical protein HDV02_003185 [Globomyces sp. JEL0801]|nr:hypothetical protein HDV02_003185 [Globomyces sp. JEL0801]